MVATKKKTSKPTDGLGLAGIGDLSALLSSNGDSASGPQSIPLELIDEDPNQPRTEDNPGFSKESLAELAATIKARGVKSPISLRDNPNEPGRYLINHGARRYRASVIAEKTTIPAFIDNNYLEEDQVIENIQRNELTAREIANFIGRKLNEGQKKGEIAKILGKSPAFITQHVTLLDLPEPIAEAFASGRANDVTVVNELVSAYKKAPEKVEAWLGDESQELTRGSVKLLKEFLDDSDRDPNTVDAFTNKADSEEGGEKEQPEATASKKKEPKDNDPDKFKKAIVVVEHDGRQGRLMLSKRPPAEGFAWIKYDDDGHEFEANLSEVTLVALMEA